MYNGAITLRMLRVKYGNAGGGSDLHRQIRAVDQHGNTIINIIVIVDIIVSIVIVTTIVIIIIIGPA